MKQYTFDEYQKLIQEIWEHNRFYYEENNPVISDQEFDGLLKKLEVIEKQHPEWVKETSPTQKVNESVAQKNVPISKSIEHKNPMLSLSNTYSLKEIEDYITRMHKLAGHNEISFSCELKMDGIAISAVYENGFFARGVTRGDGRSGEDITANMKTIKTLPLKLDGDDIPAYLEVRGEVFMSHEVFNELNLERAASDEPLWANPRNAAGGSLKLLDESQAAKRKLSIAFYAVSEDSSNTLKSQYESFDFLKKLGFPVLEHHALCKTVDEIWGFAENIGKLRKSLKYDIDGVVIKVDNLKEQKRLGNTGKSPRWAVAYKFAAEQATSRILNITVQVGRTGILTPVAELSPVFLAGSRIARTTLHNEDEIKRKDIRIGDLVTIEKGGDVIPKVVSVDFEARPVDSHPWHMPDACPSCGARVEKTVGEVAVRCPNSRDCPDQALNRLEHFAGKNAMDIENLGEKVIEQLVLKGFVSVPSDFYSLTKEKLYKLDGFKEKSVNNLLESIDQSKNVTLDRFVMALGIKHIGSETAELLAKRAGSIEALMALTLDEITQIRGVGEKGAKSIIDYFTKSENIQEIKKLLELGIKPKELQGLNFADHAFKDKIFVITGTLNDWTRDKASALIKERGGKVTESVSKKTNFLLAGESAGSKLEKAHVLGVKVIDENEFSKMLD